MIVSYVRVFALGFVFGLFLLQGQVFGSQSVAAPEASREVLVLYRLAPLMDWRPGRSTARADYERALIARTRFFEESVFGNARDGLMTLWLVNGSVAHVSSEEKRRLEAHPDVAEVVDMGATISLDPSPEILEPALKYTYGLERLRIPQLWAARPEAIGSGVRVAILDTGIDPNHPDLKGKVQSFKDFTPERNDTIRDDHGHGTHIAGTIAGGQTSGRAIGVAPGAELIVAKGFTRSGSTVDTWLLEAMQWIADPDSDPETEDQAQIASNSWANESAYATREPAEVYFCRAVTEWRNLGILPVFSTGNEGPDRFTVLIPGACPDAVAVGGTDYDDEIMEMSSRGPVRWKAFRLTKPEIVAPGSGISSATPGGGYRSRSGTSMAVPHIAGAFAILRQLDLEAVWADLETALYGGADDLGSRGRDDTYGHGRANVMKAVERLDSKTKR